jgi:hypothetical protein
MFFPNLLNKIKTRKLNCYAHIKLTPTIPKPTTTTFFLSLPWFSFSKASAPSEPPSIGLALICSMGAWGCQLLDMIAVLQLMYQINLSDFNSRTSGELYTRED